MQTLATRHAAKQFGLSTPAVNAKGAGKVGGGRTPSSPGANSMNSLASFGNKGRSARSPFADLSTNDTVRSPMIAMNSQRGEKPCQWELMVPRWDKEGEERITKFPLPVPEGTGKQVSHTKEADPRCAASLHGGYVTKEQDDPGTTVIRIKEKTHARLAKESEQGTVMNHAFTDRFVRSQSGGAMKSLLKGDGKHHLEPEIHSEKLDTSVKVAAGQVIQVDIGNKGKPPYLLQTEWPGILAQFQTMTNFSGRLMYNRQLPKDKAGNGKLCARGCEPEAKQPNRMQKSQSMQAVLQNMPYEGGETEAESVARKELGCKRLVQPQPDSIDTVVYGDNIPVRNIKDYKWQRTTHHFTYDGGVFQMNPDLSPTPEPPQKPIRKPGVFKNGCSEFTAWKSGKADVNRYNQDVHRPLKRAVSEPPSAIDGDTTTHFEHGEGLEFDIANRPPRSQPHLQCSPGGIDVQIKHCTPEEVAIAREQRLAEDGKFLEKCQKMAEAHSTMREVVSSNKPNVHHLGSAGVARVLQWN